MSNEGPGLRRRRLVAGGIGAAAGLLGTGLIGPGGGTGRAADAPAGAPASEGELTVATVTDGGFGQVLRNGVELEIDAVNAAGGVLGRKLRLHSEIVDLTQGNIRAAAIDVASRVTRQRDLVAVIGHSAVADALPAAIRYLRDDVLLVAPSITTNSLTMHGLRNLFATLPDDSEVTMQTTRFLASLGLRRGLVLRERGPEALQVSLAYRDSSAKLGIAVVDEVPLRAVGDVRNVTSRLQALTVDHLLLVCSLEWQAEILRFTASLGLNVLCVLPTIQNPAVVQRELARALGANTSAPFRVRALVPVLRDNRAPTPAQAAWEHAYEERYKLPAVDFAMQGTDAVGLLVEAMKIVGRIGLPGQDRATARKQLVDDLSQVMRGELAYAGIGGRISFRRDGRIYTRMLGFASIRSREEKDTVYYMPGA